MWAIYVFRKKIPGGHIFFIERNSIGIVICVYVKEDTVFLIAFLSHKFVSNVLFNLHFDLIPYHFLHKNHAL